VPDFVETGGDGVSPGSLGSGGLVGNMTVQDGFLQSSNYVAGTTGWQLTPTGGDFNFAIQADEVHVPDINTTANSAHIDSDGDTWWGTTKTNFDADNNNALAYILKTGVAKFQSVILSGSVSISGIANNTATDISLLEKTHNLVFSVTDANTIAWTSGTVTLSNGRTFSISSGNTGNMSALTYIYIDPAVSSTVLQTTTTYSTATGNNKILIGTAQNNTVTASYIPYGPGQPLIDGANIGALSIVAANIAASTITASKMTVTQLSAISADMGSITAGTIVVPSAGYIRSGQTAFNTGTGWYIGNDSGTPKLSIGNSSNYMRWNGSQLEVSALIQTLVSLSTNQPINGSVTPVPVLAMSDGTVVVADANDSDLDDFIGFIINDYSSHTPPAYLNSVSGTGTSLSLTANAGTDRCLVVWIHQDDGSSSGAPSAVSWNSLSLTKFSDTTIGTSNVSGWRVVIGSNAGGTTSNISVTVSGSGVAILAVVYQYVNQTTPLGTAVTATGAASSGSINTSITPTKSYSLIATIAAMDGTHTLDSSFTAREDEEGSGGNNSKVGDGYSSGLSSVSVTHSISPNASNRTIHLVEVLPSVTTSVLVAVAGGVTFPGPLTTGNYYLQDTAGTIGTSPGSTSVRVGKAVSTTQLLIIQP
jgi:hypothetical protein